LISAAQRIRLGVFLAVGSGLLLVVIGLVAGTKLLERWDEYTVRYRDVSVGGLEVGADVKYSGIWVGRVEDVRIDPEDVATVVVKLSVRDGTPIKEDAEASIVTMGITGIKAIEIRGGTQEAATVPPGSEIRAGVSALESITGRAEVVAEKLEQVLNNLIALTGEDNRDNFVDAVDNTARLMATLDTVITRNQASLERSVGNVEVLTAELADLVRTAGRVATAMDSLLCSPSLQHTVANLERVAEDLSEAEIRTLAADLSEAARQANLTFTRVDLTLLKSRQDILQSLESLREGMEYFNEFARLIAENPSLLLRAKPQEEILE